MNIKERREELGMTQVELAKACKVSVNTVSAWEKGVTTPKDDNLVKLERALGVKDGK